MYTETAGTDSDLLTPAGWRLIENLLQATESLSSYLLENISGPKAPKKLCELLATIVTEEGGRYAIASK